MSEDRGAVTTPPRPRQVTFGATQAIIGSALGLVLLIGSMEQLNSAAMNDVLRQVLDSPQASELDLTLESLRTLMKYAIMGLAVVSATTMVLGVFVLRRDRAARIVLTLLGGLVILITLLSGPSGWAVTLYVGLSLALLWSRPARAWFARSTPSAAPPPGMHPPPPSGWQPPPPPPPPPPRR